LPSSIAAGDARIPAVQRDDTTGRKRWQPRGKKLGTFPLEITDLRDALNEMPALAAQIGRLKVWRTKDPRLAGIKRIELEGTVVAATIFCLDAIYRFDGQGLLAEVESNYVTPPKDEDDTPPVKFKVPDKSIIIMSEPATRSTWQVLQAVDGNLAAVPFTGLKPPDGSFGPGDLVILGYYSGWAADVASIERPGYKREGGKAGGTSTTTEPKKDTALKEAEQQLERVRNSLGRGLEEGDAQGTGSGAAGTGAGGGGEARIGAGGGATGVGTGTGLLVVGAGKGGKPKVRAKPDNVTVWQGKRGPMINVWVGPGVVSFPLKQGEKDDVLRQRIQEAAGQMKSSGKRLATTEKPPPGMEGGRGGANASAADIAEADKFTATGMAYPSKMEMQGGSGAEVSPRSATFPIPLPSPNCFATSTPRSVVWISSATSRGTAAWRSRMS